MIMIMFLNLVQIHDVIKENNLLLIRGLLLLPRTARKQHTAHGLRRICACEYNVISCDIPGDILA